MSKPRKQPGPPDWSDLLSVSVDRCATAPLFRQLHAELRRAILGGAVAPGSRLPATRMLAAKLGVSRTLVVSVYEQLVAEGYASGRAGAGTFVSRDMLEPPLHPGPVAASAPVERPSIAARYARLRPEPSQFQQLAFTVGRCSVDERTMGVWRSLSAAQLRRPDHAWFGYSDPRGDEALRATLARYLRAARGVQCEPDQILILAGVQQAIDLVTKILIEPGDAIWMEDPTYAATHGAFVAAQARIVPVPVDRSGLVVSAGIAASPVARAVYVTPSHQSPSGVVLSMARRLELLAWARQARAWVIEDDYDSEFRYAGRPLASLQGIDGGERVIYLGTFSKVLFPGLRLGYAVVPHELLDAMIAARYLADRHPPAMTEGIVTAFIEQGHFAAHLRRMCAQYQRARDHVVTGLHGRLGDLLEIDVPDQGMHLTARLPPGVSDIAVAAEGLASGVVLRPMSRLYLAAPPVSALMLGFTGFDRMQLDAGMDRLAAVLRAHCSSSATQAMGSR